jgi:hypothetical protein
MNRAQKSAWFGLVAFLFSDMLLGIYFVVMFIPRGTPVRAVLGFGVPAVTLAVLGILLWRFRRKQSPVEPAQDERDRIINRNAVAVSFVGLCAMVTTAATVPIVILGGDGAVPVTALTVVQLGIFMAAMTIYFAAIVLQYRIDGGKL